MVDCRLCERERGDGKDGSSLVHRDPLWSVYLDSGLAIPGWLVIQLRRHGEGPMGMNAEEAAAFGPLLVRVSAAISNATSAEKIYVTGLGEKYDHWHVLVSARGADVAPQDRGLKLFSRIRELADPEAARRIAARVGESLGDPSAPRSS